MNNDLEKLDNSLLNNQLYSYLTGKDGYGYIQRLADMPTDPEIVFASISRYAELNKLRSVWVIFEHNLIKMCDDSEDIWLVIYYISCYLFYQEYTGNDFIDIRTVTQRFKFGVDKYQKELSENHKWDGYQWPNGLMGDINRMLNNLRDRFNFNLTDENLGAV